MILLFDKENIDKVWDRVSVGVAKAATYSEVSSLYSITSLYDSIKSGDSLAFYQVESGYGGIFTVNQYPSKKILYVHHGGKDDAIEGPVNYEEMDEFLVNVARIYDCSAISVEGRRGWERKVKHLGYNLETITIFKEVTK